MPGIGPPPRGTVSSENISDLQPGTGQDPGASLQASPQGLILQVGQHLVGADRVFNRFGGDMGILRRSRQFGVAEQNLDHPHIGVCFQQVRCEAVPQCVQRGGLTDPSHMLGRCEGPVQLAR